MQLDPVVVRAPPPEVRPLLRPSGLPSLVPGLRSDGGTTAVLSLWRRGEVERFNVVLESLPDGSGSLIRSDGDPGPDFQLSLSVLADHGRPVGDGTPPHSRLAVDARVRVEPADGAGRVAWLQHLLPLLGSEVAASVEDMLSQDQPSGSRGVHTAEDVAPVLGSPNIKGRAAHDSAGRPRPGLPLAMVVGTVAVAVAVVVVRLHRSRQA